MVKVMLWKCLEVTKVTPCLQFLNLQSAVPEDYPGCFSPVPDGHLPITEGHLPVLDSYLSVPDDCSHIYTTCITKGVHIEQLKHTFSLEYMYANLVDVSDETRAPLHGLWLIDYTQKDEILNEHKNIGI